MGAGHEHAHDHGPGAGRERLRVALVVTAAIAALEFVGGLRSGSLALLADAAHVAMDVVALGIALAAALASRRVATARQTFGFARAEVLAALANGALLTAVTVVVALEAVRRFGAPVEPRAGVMAAVAAVGLAANLAVGLYLHRGGTHGAHDLNTRAAILHVAGDALGAFAVLVGGVAIAFTGASWIDPLLSLVVAAIIVAGVVRVGRDATHVLLESAPEHLEVPAVREAMRAVEGVVEVHDLHVWTIGTGSHALAAHVVLDDRTLSAAAIVLRRLEALLAHDFAIAHTTIQLECESCGPDTAIVCTQGERPAAFSAVR